MTRGRFGAVSSATLLMRLALRKESSQKPKLLTTSLRLLPKFRIRKLEAKKIQPASTSWTCLVPCAALSQSRVNSSSKGTRRTR